MALHNFNNAYTWLQVVDILQQDIKNTLDTHMQLKKYTCLYSLLMLSLSLLNNIGYAMLSDQSRINKVD